MELYCVAEKKGYLLNTLNRTICLYPLEEQPWALASWSELSLKILFSKYQHFSCKWNMNGPYVINPGIWNTIKHYVDRNTSHGFICNVKFEFEMFEF